jgi:hypothetical protein
MKNISTSTIVACLTLVGVAFADDTVRYSKAETDALVVGKKVEWVRVRDGAKLTYTFKDGGDVFFTTSNTVRNIPISGTYNVTDRGSVCFKWNQDKFLAMQDGCIAFAHDGAKTQVVSATDPTKVLGQVAE